MKKDELLGIEVYYEDNPQPRCCPTGHEGQAGPKGVGTLARVQAGVWVFGDSDEEDDFSDDEYVDEFDSEAWVNNGDEEFEQESRPVPIRGRIYFVKGLDITAKLKEIRPLTKIAGILEMSHHGSTFYINPSDLRKASSRQVTHYLEESD